MRIELTHPETKAEGYAEVVGDEVRLLLPPLPLLTMTTLQAATIADAVNIWRRPFAGGISERGTDEAEG